MADICGDCIHWKFCDWTGKRECEVVGGPLPTDWDACLFRKVESEHKEGQR